MYHETHPRSQPCLPAVAPYRHRSRTTATAMALAALLALGTAACGDDGETATSTEPTETSAVEASAPSPSTSSPTTSSVASTEPSSTSTSPLTETTTTGVSGGDDGADGSGCSPGQGSLPDGSWYGQASVATADELAFDLACWFSGDAAAAAAAADGEESPPPNDYYVRDFADTVRIVHPAIDTPVRWYPQLGDPASETDTTYGSWVETNSERLRPGIWITIDGGRVTAIAEQWVP